MPKCVQFVGNSFNSKHTSNEQKREYVSKQAMNGTYHIMNFVRGIIGLNRNHKKLVDLRHNFEIRRENLTWAYRDLNNLN